MNIDKLPKKIIEILKENIGEFEVILKITKGGSPGEFWLTVTGKDWKSVEFEALGWTALNAAVQMELEELRPDDKGVS